MLSLINYNWLIIWLMIIWLDLIWLILNNQIKSNHLTHCLKKYNLVHYQGHAEFHSADILQNSVLKLYGQDVSIHSLFETEILQSPHISLVAEAFHWRWTAGFPDGFDNSWRRLGTRNSLGIGWDSCKLSIYRTLLQRPWHWYPNGKTNFCLSARRSTSKSCLCNA